MTPSNGADADARAGTSSVQAVGGAVPREYNQADVREC